MPALTRQRAQKDRAVRRTAHNIDVPTDRGHEGDKRVGSVPAAHEAITRQGMEHAP